MQNEFLNSLRVGMNKRSDHDHIGAEGGRRVDKR